MTAEMPIPFSRSAPFGSWRGGGRLALAAAGVLVAGPAFAHTGVGPTSGFAAGFLHPMFGLDHVLAMVGVGLWAGLAGGRAFWVYPLAFIAAMIAGGALGMAGVTLPAVEIVIALSVIVLGLATAFGLALPTAIGAVVCGAFAVFHGHAHGAEMPETVGALAYGAGFVAATALLHGAGLGLAALANRQQLRVLVRAAGGVTALAGLSLLIG